MHPNTALIGRVILGCVFIYASVDKIRHPNLFAEIVYNYQLLPDAAVNLLAIWLPWLELVSGVLLLSGIWIRGSITVLSSLMLIFLSAMGINLARGLDISCGCFATQSSDPMTILTLFRDSLFLFLAFYLFWLYPVKRVEERFSLAGFFRRN